MLAPAPNAFDLLFSTLAPHPALARRVLLSRGVTGPTLAHDLVADQPFRAAGHSVPASSLVAFGRLLEQLATDPCGPSSAQDQLRTAVLDALGEAGQRWWHLEGEDSMSVDRQLDPLRRPAALLLAADPARMWAAVGPLGLDRDGGVAAARTTALLGEIAKAPEMANVLAAVAAFEADRLSVELATGRSVTGAPVEAAALRLGYVVGFTASSAAEALTHAAQQHDALSTRVRTLARDIASVVDLLPLTYAGPVGVVAAAVLEPAKRVILRIVDHANPVDHAGRAAAHADAVLANSGELAAASARGAIRLRIGDDEAALTVISLAASSSVQAGAAAVNRKAPAPRRSP